MPIIKDLNAKEIFDSRGNPTLEVSCFLESGHVGTFSVPSGASTGSNEAIELRDNDLSYKNGKGVFRAIDNVNLEIKNHLLGKDFDCFSLDQFLIDLDATTNKSRLGANAILGVSISFAKALASEKNIELFELLQQYSKFKKNKFPIPSFNIINGGMHSDNGLDIQEFMICPILEVSFKEKLDISISIMENLKKLLVENNQSVAYGDEGGFSPKLDSNESALEYIVKSIEKSGYNTEQIKICLDIASSSFYEDNFYNLKIAGVSKKLDRNQLIDWYKEISANYPILSIEDGLMEEDWEGFNLLKTLLPYTNIVGDDLTVTNIERIKKAIDKNSINAVIIKPNQIGTLKETIEAILLCQNNNIKTFTSHRSGETMDSFISDLSYAMSSDFIKSGAPTKMERLVKYDRLVEIEKNI